MDTAENRATSSSQNTSNTAEPHPDSHQLPSPPPGTGRKLGVAATTGIIVLGGLIYMGMAPRLHRNHELSAAADEARHETNTVTFVVPRMVPTSDLTLPGNIQALEQTTINARTSGYLKKRYVDIGSRVTQGQLLAEIESPEIEQQRLQSQADTEKSRAGRLQADADVAQKRAGLAQARSELSRSQSNLRQAQAALSGAQAKLAESKAAEAVAKARQAQAEQDLVGKIAVRDQAVTQEKLARRTRERYESLLKQGFVAQQDVDQQIAADETAIAGTKAANAAIDSARANVEAAKQAVDSAKADTAAALSQVEAARESISAARASVDSTQATIDAASANIMASRANVQANIAAVRSSMANEQRNTVLSQFSKVVAPFTGVITSRNVEVGSLITTGNSNGDSTSNATTKTGLFGIARNDVLRIQVAVPQSYATAIHPKQKALIFVNGFSSKGNPFEGEVFQTAGALDATTRTLLTEVRLPNADYKLLPGMFASVSFPNPTKVVIPRVKANTILFDAKGTRVVILDKENRAHYIPVKIGRDYGKEIEIVEGIKGDERIVTDPTDNLKEGDIVHPVPAPEDKDK